MCKDHSISVDIIIIVISISLIIRYILKKLISLKSGSILLLASQLLWYNCYVIIVKSLCIKLAKWVFVAYKKIPEAIVEFSYKKCSISNTLGSLDWKMTLWWKTWALMTRGWKVIQESWILSRWRSFRYTITALFKISAETRWYTQVGGIEENLIKGTLQRHGHGLGQPAKDSTVPPDQKNKEWLPLLRLKGQGNRMVLRLPRR